MKIDLFGFSMCNAIIGGRATRMPPTTRTTADEVMPIWPRVLAVQCIFSRACAVQLQHLSISRSRIPKIALTRGHHRRFGDCMAPVGTGRSVAFPPERLHCRLLKGASFAGVGSGLERQSRRTPLGSPSLPASTKGNMCDQKQYRLGATLAHVPPRAFVFRRARENGRRSV